MSSNRKIYRVTLAAEDVEAFLGDCEASEWFAYDTGERVMTEDGPDAEAVLLVEPVARATTNRAAAMVH